MADEIPPFLATSVKSLSSNNNHEELFSTTKATSAWTDNETTIEADLNENTFLVVQANGNKKCPKGRDNEQRLEHENCSDVNYNKQSSGNGVAANGKEALSSRASDRNDNTPPIVVEMWDETEEVRSPALKSSESIRLPSTSRQADLFVDREEREPTPFYLGSFPAISGGGLDSALGQNLRIEREPTPFFDNKVPILKPTGGSLLAPVAIETKFERELTPFYDSGIGKMNSNGDIAESLSGNQQTSNSSKPSLNGGLASPDQKSRRNVDSAMLLVQESKTHYANDNRKQNRPNDSAMQRQHEPETSTFNECQPQREERRNSTLSRSETIQQPAFKNSRHANDVKLNIREEKRGGDNRECRAKGDKAERRSRSETKEIRQVTVEAPRPRALSVPRDTSPTIANVHAGKLCNGKTLRKSEAGVPPARKTVRASISPSTLTKVITGPVLSTKSTAGPTASTGVPVMDIAPSTASVTPAAQTKSTTGSRMPTTARIRATVSAKAAAIAPTTAKSTITTTAISKATNILHSSTKDTTAATALIQTTICANQASNSRAHIAKLTHGPVLILTARVTNSPPSTKQSSSVTTTSDPESESKVQSSNGTSTVPRSELEERFVRHPPNTRMCTVKPADGAVGTAVTKASDVTMTRTDKIVNTKEQTDQPISTSTTPGNTNRMPSMKEGITLDAALIPGEPESPKAKSSLASRLKKTMKVLLPQSDFSKSSNENMDLTPDTRNAKSKKLKNAKSDLSTANLGFTPDDKITIASTVTESTESLLAASTSNRQETNPSESTPADRPKPAKSSFFSSVLSTFQRNRSRSDKNSQHERESSKRQLFSSKSRGSRSNRTTNTSNGSQNSTQSPPSNVSGNPPSSNKNLSDYSPFGSRTTEGVCFLVLMTLLCLYMDMPIEKFVCYVLATFYTFCVLRLIGFIE